MAVKFILGGFRVSASRSISHKIPRHRRGIVWKPDRTAWRRVERGGGGKEGDGEEEEEESHTFVWTLCSLTLSPCVLIRLLSLRNSENYCHMCELHIRYPVTFIWYVNVWDVKTWLQLPLNWATWRIKRHAGARVRVVGSTAPLETWIRFAVMINFVQVE